MSLNWRDVTSRLREIVDIQKRLQPSVQQLNERQRASLRWASVRLIKGGFVLADEVGLGKTRVACTVAKAVLDCGGRAAAIVPRGLIPQWTREWKTIAADDPDRLKSITTFNNFVTELASDGRKRRGKISDSQSLEQRITRAFPAPEEPEFWLISHGLSTPQIRFHDTSFRRAPWSIALPALVRARLGEHAANKDGRTAAGRLNRVENRLRDTMTADAWRIVLDMAEQVTPAVCSDHRLIADLQSMPWFDPRYEKDNSEYAVQFQNRGLGADVFRRILAHWLGAFDLLIIDEAHKARGDEISTADEEVEKRTKTKETDLSRLLASTIRMTSDARRIGLTATPLELGAHQWRDLLIRVLRGPTDFDPEVGASHISETAQDFDRATAAARRFLADTTRDLPEPIVDVVCSASCKMSKALSSVMTRRRRARDVMYENFRAALRERGHDRSEWSRPHRQIECVQIQTHHLLGSSDEGNLYVQAWTQAFFAMECLGAALGEYKQLAEAGDKRIVELTQKFRAAYTRLAAGHLGEQYEEGLSKFKEEANRLAIENSPAGRRAKRISYWVQQEIIALERVAGTTEKVDPLTEHPRIRAAVEVIERFTSPQDPSIEPEKVLVFGTFLAPMRVLARVLEVRHSLRRLAQGRPVPLALGKDIQPLVHRQALRMHDELLRYASNWNGSQRAIEAAWENAKARYSELLAIAKTRIEHNVPDFLFTKLGIESKHRHYAMIANQLAPLARESFLDGLLYGADSSWTLAKKLDDALTQAALEQFWQEVIEPSLEQARETDDDQELSSQVVAILDMLSGDDGGQDTHHVRVLHGATKYTARQSIQARFNRQRAAPHVLVAQSRVGREGLDFHRACRVVIQFNAEWNPGVLEQQIGRVDRIDSKWERLAKDWIDSPLSQSAEPPYIEVRRLVLRGTYDAFQWDSVHAREHLFDATLYGELLPAEALANQPPHIRQKLADAAPDFEPAAK